MSITWIELMFNKFLLADDSAMKSTFIFCTTHPRASLVTQMATNPPAVQETWVQSLGWEDPLEQGMATHSSILSIKKSDH